MDAVPPSAAELLDRWLVTLQSSATRSAYGTDLRAYLGWCRATGVDPLEAMHEQREAFRKDQIGQGDRPSTVARRASALNGFMRFAAAHASPTAPQQPNTPGARVPSSPTTGLDHDQREQLLASLPGQRTVTQLLVSILLLDGLKLDEALHLDWSHLSGRHPSITAHVERGPASRDIALDPRTADVVRAHGSGSHPGPVLLSSGGTQAGQRLGRFGADYLVKKAGRAAGLPDALTANVLRRTHVAEAGRSGMPVEQIRRHMGHADARTTRRYLSTNTLPVWARTVSLDHRRSEPCHCC